MQSMRWGIVGTGFIAEVIANAIVQAQANQLVAVASRSLEKAEQFVTRFPGVQALQDMPALVESDIDAIYVATPTTTKESLALSAATAGKHILVDKPFANLDSVTRQVQAAHDAGVLFMDATHFTHHPRTAAIRSSMPAKLGEPCSLHTTFYFPSSGEDNIRLDRTLEPAGALGDMAWYSMRSMVEFLQPCGEPVSISSTVQRNESTKAVVRAGGHIAFTDGKSSTFDVGYTASTAIMDLCLIGTRGVISMDDFVLDWTNSFAFNNPDIEAGFHYRTGTMNRNQTQFVATPATTPQQVLMIEQFSRLAAENDATTMSALTAMTLRTQRYLDAVWNASVDPAT